MRSSVAPVAIAFTLLVQLPAVAAGGQPATQPVAPAQAFTPFTGSLFVQKASPTPPRIDWSRRPPADQRLAVPSVRCGMTLVPADPKIDPKIRVSPLDAGVEYTLKVVEPTVCQAPPQR